MAQWSEDLGGWVQKVRWAGAAVGRGAAQGQGALGDLMMWPAGRAGAQRPAVRGCGAGAQRGGARWSREGGMHGLEAKGGFWATGQVAWGGGEEGVVA